MNNCVAKLFPWVYALAAALVLMVVCGYKTPMVMARENPGSPPSDSLVVNFYLDTSISMKYFLTERPVRTGQQPARNYLKDFLYDVKGVLIGKHPNYSLSLWQFGESLKHIDDNNIEKFRNNLTLFKDKNTFIEEAIDDAIQKSKESSSSRHLSIILTDLYESQMGPKGGQDIESLARKLGDQFLTDKGKPGVHCAVGIFGIRNPFYGSIDELATPAKIQDAADTLPFYLLIVGPQPDVTGSMHALDEWAKDPQQHVPSSNLLEMEFFDTNPDVEDRPMVTPPPSEVYRDQDPRAGTSPDEPHWQLKTSKSDPKIDFSDEKLGTPFLPFSTSTSENPTVQLFYWKGGSWSLVDSAPVLKEPATRNATKIRLAVNGSKLEHYPARFQISIRARLDQDALDKTVNAWGMGVHESDDVIRDGKFKDRVGKTMGLKKWTDGLASRHTSDLVYARYHFYLKR